MRWVVVLAMLAGCAAQPDPFLEATEAAGKRATTEGQRVLDRRGDYLALCEAQMPAANAQALGACTRQMMRAELDRIEQRMQSEFATIELRAAQVRRY